MKIRKEHQFHGAALTQIAEHPQFTAINAVRTTGDKISRSAFRINDEIGIYLKYATSPVQSSDDYIFTFEPSHKEELQKLRDMCQKVFIVLICVKGSEICCIPYRDLTRWFKKRYSEVGKNEETSTLLVGLPRNKSFRVNMNQPGTRGTYLDHPQIVSRNRFPKALFN